MRRWAASICVAAGALLLPACASGQTRPSSQPAAQSLADEVNDLVKQMSDKDFRKRESASEAARDLPPEAIPLLEKAEDQSNLPEVRHRIDQAAPIITARGRATLLERQVMELAAAERREAIAAITASNTGPALSPQCLAAVRAAIDAYPFEPQDLLTSPQRAKVDALFDRADDLGCQDPLFRFLALRHRVLDGATPIEQSIDDLDTLLRHILAGPYSPELQLDCTAYCLEQLAKAVPYYSDADKHRLIASAVANLHWGSKHKSLPSVTYRIVAAQLLESAPLTRDSNFGPSESPTLDPQFMKLVQQLRADAPDPEDADVMEAIGWFRRGRLCQVQAKKNLVFGLNDVYDREATAEFSRCSALLAKAMAADPLDPQPPTLMLTLAEVTGGSRQDADKWYAAAMKADPENKAAASAMLVYLENHSNDDPNSAELLQFGKGWAASRAWKSGLPLLLVDVQLHLAHYTITGPHNDHLSDPAAWGDVKYVFETYLRHHPTEDRTRNLYASIAAHSHHWKEAAEQISILGDDVDYSMFNGKAEYDYLMRKMHQALSAGQ